jgi:hypothetical protein
LAGRSAAVDKARAVAPVEFRALLGTALSEAGVVANYDEYRNVRARVSREGSDALALLRGAIGPKVWDRAAAEIRFSNQPDQVRVLGYGCLLTQFTSAWVDVGAAAREDVVTLGTLANLIVTWYDQYVDRCATPGVLPRWALRDVLAGRRRWLHVLASAFAPHGARFMSRLVDEYLARLRCLEGEARTAIPSLLLRRMILAMYDAHACATARGDAQSMISPSVRKAALPFVVMALPVWLAATATDWSLLGAHVRWTYRLGAFIGWIDDAVDVEQDRAARHYNRVARALERGVAEAGATVQSIVRLGSRVLFEWHRRVPKGMGGAMADVGSALGATISSWFATHGVTLKRSE